MLYEFHKYKETDLKIIFHSTSFRKGVVRGFNLHRNPELLLVTEGTLTVYFDGQPKNFKPGELAIVRSNVLHSFNTADEICKYHCLIIDHSLCENIDALPEYSNDATVISIYNSIANELESKQYNYKQVVIGYCKSLLALLSRAAIHEGLPAYTMSPKTELMRNTFQYIYDNFQKPISTKDISEAMSVSQYYLSHVFKSSTGKTVLEILQFVRCKNAYAMLSSGRFNVSQSAFKSGFNNLSYFSKTYKKIMGKLPVDELKSQKQ